VKGFAALYAAIDRSTKTTDKVAALRTYFETAPAADAAWAIYFLTGRRPRRPVASTKLQIWAAELADIPTWLFTECYDAVGDLAETINLVLPPKSEEAAIESLSEWIEQRILRLAELDELTQRAEVERAWRQLDGLERFLFNKLITGAFRVGVSQELALRGVSEAHGIARPTLAHRIMGDWSPTATWFDRFVSPAEDYERDPSRPYPFCLAHPLEANPEELGDPSDWIVEWKWDGIRAQVIRRRGQTFVWSRGEELITERFPEIKRLGDALPDGTVLDGEILGWRDETPLPFADLQRRIGRKTVGKKLLDEVPVVLMAFDTLEWEGADLRNLSTWERRQRLANLIDLPNLIAAESLAPQSWEDAARIRSESRTAQAEGLMLKRRRAPYGVGRKRGDWWKWKVEPYTVDAVLVYAQRGSGKRASIYTDYTFAVWKGDQLVPFAKAYSGLTDEEIRRVDAFVRRNTQEKFGPVRTVAPELVMELAFEGIQRSSRHKSGIAVRFPRIVRWRHDKGPADADRIETVLAMLDSTTEDPD